MRLKNLFLVVVAGAGAASAQTAVPPSQVVTPAATRPATARQKSEARPAMPSPVKPSPVKTLPAKSPASTPIIKPVASNIAAPIVRKPSNELAIQPDAQAPPSAPAAPPKTSRRDPFVSPIVRAEAGKGPSCEGSGKKCLAADHVVLRGVVRAPSGMIAVVESTGRKISYFLRENDPVFNGYVVRITPDSVTFRESTNDTFGHQGTRDIVKRVTAPAV